MAKFYLSVYLLSSIVSLANAFVTPTPGTFVVSTQGPSPSWRNKKETSFPFVNSLSMTATSSSTAPPKLSDEVLIALLTDTAIDNGITDYDVEEALKLVKGCMESKEMTFGGRYTKTTATDEPPYVGLASASSDVSSSVSVSSGLFDISQSVSVKGDYGCELAIIDFSLEAVALALSAAGMPSGAGKRVAKILVKKARKKLMKEMKGIVKDYFGSLNPVNIAAGLYAIISLIIGEVGFGTITDAIWDAVSWWDATQIIALLTLYFVSAGSGLAAKLAFMIPAIIDVVEAGYDVSQEC